MRENDVKKRSSNDPVYETFSHEIFTLDENPIIKRILPELEKIPIDYRPRNILILFTWNFKIITKKLSCLIFKVSQHLLRTDNVVVDEESESDWKRTQKRAQSNGQPFRLYVEVLVVTDHSIFENHKRFARSNDTNIVFHHMRIYYAHFMNEVRYFCFKLKIIFIKIWIYSILGVLRWINAFNIRLLTIPTCVWLFV